MRKLRHFQQLGHTVIFLMGDLTSLIGDPTGRNVTRKPLTRGRSTKMPRPTSSRCFGFSMGKTEVRYNSEWLDKLGYEGRSVWPLRSPYRRCSTATNFITRFRRSSHQPPRISVSALQAYDSVAFEMRR